MALNAQNITLENESCQLAIDLNGATITGFNLKDSPTNAVHDEFGHFLVFDRWGPSEDADIPFHGNGRQIPWNLLQAPAGENGYLYTEMSGTLPIVKLTMNRKVYLDKKTTVVRVLEEITNENNVEKVFNVVQHATIGQPFLDENTIVDTEVVEGFSQKDVTNSPPAPEDIISWPQALVDGQDRDLRYLTRDVGNSSVVVTYLLDKNDDYGWVTATNTTQGFLLGYLWPISSYPWLNLWLRVKNNKPEARGLEFGTTGLHRVWSELLERKTLLDEPIYETIGVGDTIKKSYLMFLAPVPDNFAGVEKVTLVNNQINIYEYGLAPERTFVLTLSSLITSTSKEAENHNLKKISLSQNYPNPFRESTTIEYYLPHPGFVVLEIYDLSGKKVRTIVNENQRSGFHTSFVHALGLPNGNYKYRLQVDNYQSLVRELCIVR